MPAKTQRAVLLDLFRTVALIGMATFHFMFDLAMFRFVAAETVNFGFWPMWARVVASTFLTLSGFGLYLAYGQGIDVRRLAKRLAKIGGAAVLVSIGTWFAVGPQAYVFWGILHMIAFGSVAGLLVLHLPALVTLVLAAGVFWIGWTVALPAFDPAPLLWLGLNASQVFSVDYVPVFPWFSAVLVGVALGRLAVSSGLWARLAAVTVPKGSLWDWLAFPGRHSLIVYLVHQPVLFGLVMAYANLTR